MQRVDIYIDRITVLVHDLDGLLGVLPDLDGMQARKFSDAMCDVGDVVARVELPQLLEGNGLRTLLASIGLVPVIAVKYLVVGIASHLEAMVPKAFMQI